MADTKVSALTAATTALAADEFPVNEAGTSKKVTLAQILDASRADDPGNVTMTTATTLTAYDRLALSSTNRLTMPGTAEVVLNNVRQEPVVYRGKPKAHWRSFTVPTDWEYIVVNRLSLNDPARASFQGNCDVILSDDFGTRSRIVLAGRG